MRSASSFYICKKLFHSPLQLEATLTSRIRLTGPVLEVVVNGSSNEKTSWTLPKALLTHHASYFRGLENFKEGQENKAELEDFEPDTFKLFVEYMYFGRYTYRDNLRDKVRVRDAAKAWVLGDYLGAVEFTNFAMKNLYDIYFPPNDQQPKSGIGPELVEYCCEKSSIDSTLYCLIKDALIYYWSNIEVVVNDTVNRKHWDSLWRLHPGLASDLLFYTNQDDECRRSNVYKPLAAYIPQLTIAEKDTIDGVVADIDR
jgi:hypothetical protein